VFDQDNNVAHSLSAQTVAVWNACDGTRAPREVARAAGLNEATTAAALEELDASGLLEYATEMGYSRREATKKIAKLGAAAASAPLIYSLAIAPAAAMASPVSCRAKSCTGYSRELANNTATETAARNAANLQCSTAPECLDSSTPSMCTNPGNTFSSPPGGGADRRFTGTCTFTP
jgi:hypothetical protein